MTGQTKEAKVEGGIRFHIHCEITAQDMADWKPERIMAFFRGLAQMQAAVEGVEV